MWVFLHLCMIAGSSWIGNGWWVDSMVEPRNFFREVGEYIFV